MKEVKVTNAEQRRIVHHKNAIDKLFKTNTTVWFNERYRFEHLNKRVYIYIYIYIYKIIAYSTF